MAIDKICLAENDPVLGKPTLDGFTGIEDAGVITTEPGEPGYGLGHRITYGNASLFPHVVFQGVKGRGENFIYLSFFVRKDDAFDYEDQIVIALRENFSSNVHDQKVRRIDINPLYVPIGAGDRTPTGTRTADDDAQPSPTVTSLPTGSYYHIRTNRLVNNVEHYKGQTGATPWASYGGPTGFEVRVRSWQPPVATGTTPEYAWSIEIKLPLNTQAGGSDWINLGNSFGLYFNVFRVTANSIPAIVQFVFPVDSTHQITGQFGASTPIDPGWYGQVFLPSMQSPPGSNCGQGIRFKNGNEQAVGVRDASLPDWSTLGHQISGTITNRLVAQVENTSQTDDAVGVTAEFRFANWGLGPATFPAWTKPGSLANNPTPGKTITHGGGTVELTADWPGSSIPADYRPPHQHQCMWVQLDSPNSVNFIQSSMRRNMDFVNLSEFERPAFISGRGYPVPKGGAANHNFVLITHVRQIVLRRDLKSNLPSVRLGEGWVVPNPGSLPANADLIYWLWIVNGYRRTGDTVTIRGKVFEILDDAPGSFGYVALHQGSADFLSCELTGGGIKKEREGVFSIRVPHGGEVQINTSMTAGPKAVTPCADNPADPWWLRFLKAVCRLIMRLLGR